MFLGHLIPGLPGEWIQEVRKSLAEGILGQVLTPETSSAAGGFGSVGRSGVRVAYYYFGVLAARVGLDVSSTASEGITIRDSSNGLLNDQSRTSGKDAKGAWSLP